MLGELGSVIEGEGSDEPPVEWLEPGEQTAGGGPGLFGRLLGEEQQAGLSLMGDEDGLAVFAEQHEIGLPVARLAAGVGGLRAKRDGHSIFDESGRGAAGARSAAALVFLSRQ